MVVKVLCSLGGFFLSNIKPSRLEKMLVIIVFLFILSGCTYESYARYEGSGRLTSAHLKAAEAVSKLHSGHCESIGPDDEQRQASVSADEHNGSASSKVVAQSNCTKKIGQSDK